MLELPLIFVAGLLGSSHCLGMCGPFALAIGGGAKSWRSNLLRQLVYTLGRVFTYGTLGAFAGYAGFRLQGSMILLRNGAAILAIVAGLFLIYQGLVATGILKRRGVHSHAACLGGSFLATFLRTPGCQGVFLAGIFTGLLPCGLVYGFLALAAGTASIGQGALLMVAFGLGTAPVMIAAGTGASLMSLTLRKRLYQAAAWCVILTGLISIARGAGYVEIEGYKKATGCPACQLKK
jgi:sulfite exporter TauE/SafE